MCVAHPRAFLFFIFYFSFPGGPYGPARSFFFDLFIYLFFCAKKENIADWAVDKAMYQYICMVCKCIVMLQVPPHYLFLFFFLGEQDGRGRGLLRLPIHTTRGSKGLHRNAPHWQNLSPPPPPKFSPGLKLLISPIEPMQLHYLARLGRTAGLPKAFIVMIAPYI